MRLTSFVCWVVAPSLLGQADQAAPWEGVKNAFRNALPRERGEPSVWTTAGTFVAVLLAVIFTLYLIARLLQRGTVDDSKRTPMRFFAFSLKQIGVGWLDRLLLRMAARHSGLPQPAVMLFTPELWRKHAGEWAEKLALPPLRLFARDRFRAVAEKAFPPSSGARAT